MTDKSDAQLQQLVKANAFLGRVLASPEGEIQRAAAIQAFEFCFELSWKQLKSLVEDDGSMVASPKAVFREAAAHGFIDNPEEWFSFLQARNLTVHTYVEAVSEQIYQVVKHDFFPVLQSYIEKSKKL